MKWRDLAEHQIQKARAEGQLDGLDGEGKPLPRRQGGDVVSAGLGIMAEAGVLPREIQLKKDLVVESHEVVHIQPCSADGCFSFYPGMRAMPIVVMQPVRQF